MDRGSAEALTPEKLAAAMVLRKADLSALSLKHYSCRS